MACVLVTRGRSHWTDEERRCTTHHVTWRLPWHGRARKPEDGTEPTVCPVAAAAMAAATERKRVLDLFELEMVRWRDHASTYVDQRKGDMIRLCAAQVDEIVSTIRGGL